MALVYKSGETPKPGDVVQIAYKPQVVIAEVVVVVGGSEPGAINGYSLSEWEYLNSGLLINSTEMGLVFDENPEDSFSLVRRKA